MIASLVTSLSILVILYTALEPGLFSPIGIFYWIVLSVLALLPLFFSERQNKIDRRGIWMLISFAIILIAHWLKTSDQLISLLMYWVILIVLLQLKRYNFNPRFLLLVPIIGVIIQSIIFLPDLIVALRTSNDASAFKGFFLNPNSCSIFAAVGYVSAYLSFKSKWKYLIILLCIANMFGGMSRNALLFVIIFHSYIYFQTRFKANKILLITTLFLLLASGYMLLFVDVDSMLTFFGKGGSSGRAEQLIYLNEKYGLSFWGVGRDLISDECQDLFLVSPHNMYFFTAIGMGYAYLLFYFYFVVYLFLSIKSLQAKAIWLAMQVYYFFEPVIAFEPSLSFLLPTLVVIGIENLYSRESLKNDICLDTSIKRNFHYQQCKPSSMLSHR